MSQQPSIPKTFLINMVAIAVISTTVAGALLVFREYRQYSRAAEVMQQSYRDSRKAELKGRVDQAVLFIDHLRRRTVKEIRNAVEMQAEYAAATVSGLYEQVHDTVPSPQLEEFLVRSLRDMRFENGAGTYLVWRSDGVQLLDPRQPEQDGKPLAWWTSGTAQARLAESLSTGRGTLIDPDSGELIADDARDSASYVSPVAALGFFVGARLDCGAIEERLKAEALEWIAGIEAEPGEYVFAGQWDGLSLSGPAVGENMIDVTDPNGIKIVQALIERAQAGGGYVTYVMPKLEGQRPAPKISYADGIADWQWYIGTGVYVDDIDRAVAAFRSARFREMWANVGSIVLLLTVLCFGAFYFASRVARRTRAALEGLLTFFRHVASGDGDVAASGAGFQEFHQLAEAANVMVSQRREAERALRVSEERLQTLFAQAADAIYVSDLSGRLLQVNDAACAATGYSEPELLQMNITDMDADHTAPSHLRGFFEHLAGSRRETLLSQHRRKDGSTFPVEIRISLLETPDGTQVFGIARDITERLRLESELRQAQKMEAVGQLTGGVAHDFNNLLQVINAGTALSLAELDPDHRARRTMGEVLRAGEKAASLVRQLLLFSRRQVMHPVPLELDEAITDILRLLRRVIGEQIRLEWTPRATGLWINADRGMLEQTIVNLCVNARDAMPGGGVLTIRTERAVLDPAALGFPQAGRTREFAVVSVRDTGCGMNAETLQRVFEPFFSTKEAGKGTGLGLSTVFGILDQHQGMVLAESRPGEGSTFRLCWPVCESPGAAVAHPVARPALGGKETILLAEDDEAVRQMTAMMLERNGYTVLVAENGQAALDLYRQNQGRIDLVILDVVMPVLGGRAAWEQIRAEQARCRVLFTSGYSTSSADITQILEQGFTLLQKPYTRDPLLQAVRTMLDGILPGGA